MNTWPNAHVLLWTAIAYLVMSAICAAAYAIDKSAAIRRRRRVRERTLLLLGLLGGWPGAVVAQRMLRHKTAKPAFRATFIGSVVLHLLVLTAFVASWHAMSR